jgi:hypothetical protein
VPDDRLRVPSLAPPARVTLASKTKVVEAGESYFLRRVVFRFAVFFFAADFRAFFAMLPS